MKKNVLTSFIILRLLSTVFLMGVSFNIQPVKASSTIYIRAEGSVDPPDAPISSLDNAIYTFTDNIYDDIVVQRSNIIIDGDGYVLQGSGSGSGLYLSGINNVTIKNTNIKGFCDGVYLYQSPNNTISGNNITANKHAGIYLTNSVNCTVTRNVACFNKGAFPVWPARGIFIKNSGNCKLLENSANSNTGYGIIVDASNGCNIVANTASYNELAHGDGGGIGMEVRSSNNCIIYHNSFTNNARCRNYQVISRECYNQTWDNGYPSGGNYRSDYAGTDKYSGVFQNEPGSDGIGDTPHGQDNYPLMNPYVPETEEVRIAYRKLLGKYNKLQSDFKSLNLTYYELLDSYVGLLADFGALNATYHGLLANYDYLNSTYHTLLSNYSELQGNYESLQRSSDNLQSSYDQLQSDQEAIISELSTIRNLMYIFIATTIILIATTVYFATRKPKIKP